jgi:hypothetical protein
MTTPTSHDPNVPTYQRVRGTGVRPTYHLWLIGGSLLTLGMLTMVTLNIVSLLAHERVDEVTTIPVDVVRELDISNPNGRVEVVGGDVDEITVDSTVSHGLFETRYRVAVENGVLTIRSSCPFLTAWCGVDTRVVVPADLPVRASSDNGRVILEDLSGPVTASCNNGALDLTRLSGDLNVRSDNGEVDGSALRSQVVVASSQNGAVRLDFTEPPMDVTATSSNGQVDIVVPEDPAMYRVTVETANGGTDVKVRTDPGSDRRITATSSNGSVEVRYPTG